MIIGALLLAVSIWQITRSMSKLLRDQKADGLSWQLLIFSVICEIPAILGMVVLSHYTGDAMALQHDIGSHMLFFGHAFAIAASGWIIHRLLLQHKDKPDARLTALLGLPRHAVWTGIFCTLFAITYYSNGHLPNVSPFWHHAVLSAVEMLVLVAFLSYLVRFWRLIDTNRG